MKIDRKILSSGDEYTIRDSTFENRYYVATRDAVTGDYAVAQFTRDELHALIDDANAVLRDRRNG